MKPNLTNKNSILKMININKENIVINNNKNNIFFNCLILLIILIFILFLIFRYIEKKKNILNYRE